MNCIMFNRSGPSRLVGHSAVVYRDGLLLYGGGQSLNSPLNSLWRYSFRSESWERLTLLPGSTSPPARIHHCCLGLGPSYQPQAPPTTTTTPLPTRETKPRHFNNKCFPLRLSYLGTQPESAIELETFERTENGLTVPCAVGEGKQSCLTFENQAFCNRWSCEDVDEICEGEDLADTMEDVIAQNLPDLLLLLGGKPLGQQAALSVWQMTLTDPYP